MTDAERLLWFMAFAIMVWVGAAIALNEGE